MHRPPPRLLCWLIALLLLLPPPLLANDFSKELKITARALGFLADRPRGEVKLAVIYAPTNPDSRRAANELMAALGSGLHSGDLTLVPTLMAANRLEALATMRVALLVPGLGGERPRIFANASRLGVLTVAFERECAQVGQCVMAISSEPRVEIVVNRAAAQSSGIGFAPAFRMMITEL